MDGYSVNEAAAVLGIPEGRVWELLARGVLSGSTEVGGDVRVFLRGTAVPEPARGTGNGNGENGGSGEGGELTPFRELLTEFRNLTERYGQALLALGEARGEVASLRGRVDLLEARLDSRSPWPSAGPATWSDAPVPPPALGQAPDAPHPGSPGPEATRPEPTRPEPTAPEAEPPTASVDDSPDVVSDVLDATLGRATAAADALPEAPPPTELAAVEVVVEEPMVSETTGVEIADTADVTAPPADDMPPPRPRATPRGPAREAFSGFAAALARAQDPSTEAVAAEFEELPGSREVADAVAAYRRDLEAVATPEAPAVAEAEVAVEPGGEPLAESAVELGAEPPTEVSPGTSVEAPSASTLQPGYTTDTPEPDWIAEEDLIISAGDDPTVRADALLRQAVFERAAVPVRAEEPAASDISASEPFEEPESHVDALSVAPVVEPEAAPEASLEPEPPAAVLAEPWPEEPVSQPEPEPEPKMAVEEPAPEEPIAEAWPEPDLVREAEPRPTESRLTPLEIAAEPPAADDAALVAEPPGLDEPPFVEPPIVPQEPAFWEPGAGTKAPFAIAQPETWEPRAPEPVSVEVRGTPGEPPPAATAPEEPRRSALEPEPSLEPRPLSPAAQAGRAAAARRQPRGPAARALRRLRYLLD